MMDAGADRQTAILALTAAALSGASSCVCCSPTAAAAAATATAAGATAATGAARVESGEADLAWMRVACEQARLSPPVDTAYCVGCVLVKDGKVRAAAPRR
jgi:hypothetical protein